MDGSGIVEVLYADLKTLHEELGQLHAQATRAVAERQMQRDDRTEGRPIPGAFHVPVSTRP